MSQPEPAALTPSQLIVRGRQLGKTKSTTFAFARHVAPKDPAARELYLAQIAAIWFDAEGRDAKP